MAAGVFRCGPAAGARPKKAPATAGPRRPLHRQYRAG